MSKKIVLKLLIVFFVISTLFSCAAFKPEKVDSRKTPITGQERAKKNIAEGRGISLGNLGKSRGTNYEFSTSNPMWRASLDVLDFLPLTTVDYSGGVIITDWYSDGAGSNASIKITVRFLSNEIRSDSVKIAVHQKTCANQNNCTVNKISSKIEEELIKSIVKNAAVIDKESKAKKK